MKKAAILLVLLGLGAELAPSATPPSGDDMEAKAVELLRKTMSQPGRPAQAVKPAPVQPRSGSAGSMTYAEVEQLFLQGKISAKQFQKYLQDHKWDPNKPDAGIAAEVSKLPPPPSSGPAPAAVESAPKAVDPDSAPIFEVEKKMEELLRLKAEREKAAERNATAATNTSATAIAGPQTKRAKLDALLKVYIDGKISDTDYKERRAKIIAEPD